MTSPGKTQRFGHALADPVRCSPHRIVGKVSIPTGSHHMLMPQQLSDEHQALTAGHGDAGEAVAQIVDANSRA